MSILDDAHTRLTQAVDLTEKHLTQTRDAGGTDEQAVCALVGFMLAHAEANGYGNAATMHAVALARLAADRETIAALETRLAMYQELLTQIEERERQ